MGPLIFTVLSMGEGNLLVLPEPQTELGFPVSFPRIRSEGVAQVRTWGLGMCFVIALLTYVQQSFGGE